MLNIRSLRKAADIYGQLADYLKGIGIPAAAADAADWLTADPDGHSLRRALAAGLFMNAALLQPDGDVSNYDPSISGPKCGTACACTMLGSAWPFARGTIVSL